MRRRILKLAPDENVVQPDDICDEATCLRIC